MGRRGCILGAVLALAAAASAPGALAASCPKPSTSAAYRARVDHALRSGRDVLGEALLKAPGGPTYARAHALLQPLWWARGAHGTKLTASGAYYLPFAEPLGSAGAGSVQLHVADGGEIVARRIGGATLGIFVGASGRERYGSCLARLGEPALADGYLPILETRYTDAAGVRYREESFAARVTKRGALASFVRLDVDARHARSRATVRFVSTRRGLLGATGKLSRETATYTVARGTTRTLLLGWTTAASGPAVDATSYGAERASVVAYWTGRLAAGARIDVPDSRVEDAARAVTEQDLALTWRYSIGNPYEEFSFPESVDVAQVLAELGYTDVAESILRTSFTRRSTPYPNWKRGERLTAVAEVYRLSGDATFVARSTPVLRGYVTALARQVAAGGLLGRERYSSDIPAQVYGLHAQAVAWEGLETMGSVWAVTGQPALAATCRRAAARLGAAIRRALARSERRLDDGSLFLPARLLDGETPYTSLTEARLGSYWNLVVPYALASGIVPPGSAAARGALAYIERHGSRLVGLVRAGAYALYGDPGFPVGGTDEVYGLNVDRFLADNDEADELGLSLVGELADAMTPGTYVSGEAASVAPLGDGLRAMYLPPNTASNASLLENVRSLLVHETRSPTDEPRGLQLAFATPRAWLAAGRHVAVTGLPTSFGPVSYELSAHAGTVEATVDEPQRARPASTELRLRLPSGERIASVELAGAPWRRFDRQTGTIELPYSTSEITLVVRVDPT